MQHQPVIGSRTKGRSRPGFYHPCLETLEDRMAPGDTVVSSLMGLSVLGPGLAFLDGGARSPEDAVPGGLEGTPSSSARALPVGSEADQALSPPGLPVEQTQSESRPVEMLTGGEATGRAATDGLLTGGTAANSLQGLAALGSRTWTPSLRREADAGALEHAPFGGGVAAPFVSGRQGSRHGPSTRSPLAIVDVIPNEFSAEKTYQSEPSITVNPNDPNQIVIATFGNLPGKNGNPDFTSADGGQTWDNFSFHNYSHGDTSLDWSASGMAYQVLLSSNLNPRRSPDPTTNNPANQFTTIPGGNYNGTVDQPWIRVAQVDGQDRIYIGFNGARSTVRYSTDGGTTWANVQVDRQTTGLGDAPPTRLAINGDTVYATFERRIANVAGDYRGDVVVVRDDLGGTSDYNDLGNLGVTIAKDVILPGPNYPSSNGTTLGSERIRSSTAIAVDPGNAQRVYNAYTVVENGGAHIHLDMTNDGGVTWQTVYVVTDKSALPSLAITDSGVVGMLYTSLVDGNMETHLIQSTDDFGTSDDTFLFSFPDGDPKFLSNPYIGDYENIRSVGETFYGTFTASNNFNTAYSPYDVTVFRETYTDPDTGEFFLKDLAGNNVSFSLDPYYFALPALS